MVNEEDAEFLPAQSKTAVTAPAQHLFEGSAYRLENLVSFQVPISVVILLEKIDIEHRKRELFPIPLRTQQFRPDHLVEKSPVVQAGQIIGHRQFFDAFFIRDILVNEGK